MRTVAGLSVGCREGQPTSTHPPLTRRKQRFARSLLGGVLLVAAILRRVGARVVCSTRFVCSSSLSDIQDSLVTASKDPVVRLAQTNKTRINKPQVNIAIRKVRYLQWLRSSAFLQQTQQVYKHFVSSDLASRLKLKRLATSSNNFSMAHPPEHQRSPRC